MTRVGEDLLSTDDNQLSLTLASLAKMSAPIKTCVLGVGLADLAFHVPFVLALPTLFTLHSVLERNPSTPHGKVHDRFGVSPRIHRSITDVCSDSEIELVIVGTPNETHYAYAKAALAAGKHGTNIAIDHVSGTDLS